MGVGCQAQRRRNAMLDHMQVSTLVSSLSALLEHAEFRQGVTFGRGIYYDLEYEGMLTEEQMVTLFERNLSRRACKRDEIGFARRV